MATDFFDDDLASSARPDEERRDAPDVTPDARRELWKNETPSLSVSDLNLTRLARERHQLNGRVAGTVQEIEQLERRQNELEQQKHHLQELTRKETQYEEGKRDIVQKLDRSIIVMEKEEAQATRRAETLRELRARFKEALDELRDIDEEKWAEEDFEEELNRGLVRVEEATTLHRKGVARMDATGSRKSGGRTAHPPADAAEAVRPTPQGFRYWMTAGLALSLLPCVVLVVLFVVYFFLMGRI